MKEIDLDEKAWTIKRLTKANEELREDLYRETDRYALLESKYKDVLLGYQSATKENQKNEELVFGMTTGGNMSRYSEFLADQRD